MKARDNATAKLRNKKLRQENLREQLAAQGHVQHVVDILEKVQDPAVDIDQAQVQRYKIVLETKLKLIGKYLPDLKSQEITVETIDQALEGYEDGALDDRINRLITEAGVVAATGREEAQVKH